MQKPGRRKHERSGLVHSNGRILVAGIPGPGRWLVSEYEPTALFSLKISLATSSVGKTLVIPTPYSIKMALVDAAFRAGLSDVECADLLRSLVGVDLRVGMSEAAAVTHTFVKVRQEAKAPNWDKKKQAEGQYQASLIQKLASLYPGSLPKDWDGLDISTLKRVIDGAYELPLSVSRGCSSLWPLVVGIRPFKRR